MLYGLKKHRLTRSDCIYSYIYVIYIESIMIQFGVWEKFEKRWI